MKTSESIANISPAILKAQIAIGGVKKKAVNPFFHSKYADLASVMEVCKEHLNKEGITVVQSIDGDNVETILLHESGEWMASTTRIICARQNDPQSYGSAITYARRYGLQSMLFIPAEDDDAEGAMKRESGFIQDQPQDITPQNDVMARHNEQIKLGEVVEYCKNTLADGSKCGAKLIPGKNGKPYCLECYKLYMIEKKRKESHE